MVFLKHTDAETPYWISALTKTKYLSVLSALLSWKTDLQFSFFSIFLFVEGPCKSCPLYLRLGVHFTVGGEHDGKNMMVPLNSGSEKESKGKERSKTYELM